MKEKQRQLIIEIMKADEDSGLYNEPKVKLYTEEQVKYILDLAHRSGVHIAKISVDIDKKLKAIDIPSDEEIKEASPIVNVNAHDYYFGHLDGFIDGAKWMRDKIQGGNK